MHGPYNIKFKVHNIMLRHNIGYVPTANSAQVVKSTYLTEKKIVSCTEQHTQKQFTPTMDAASSSETSVLIQINHTAADT
jgi:hypothetical protein